MNDAKTLQNTAANTTVPAKKKRARGQSQILENGLVRIIAIFAVVLVLGMFWLASGSSKAEQQKAQIATIATAVSQLYGTQSTYNGLTSKVLASNGSIPQQWVSGTNLVSIYKSMITLASVSNPITGLTDGAWSLSIANVPQDGCNFLATSQDAPNQIQLVAGKSTATLGANTPPTLAPATAQTACASGQNTMTWTMQ